MGKNDDGYWESEDHPPRGGSVIEPVFDPPPPPSPPDEGRERQESKPPRGKSAPPPTGKGKLEYDEVRLGKYKRPKYEIGRSAGQLNIGQNSRRKPRPGLGFSILDRIRRRLGSRTNPLGEALPALVIGSGEEEMLPAFIYIASDDAVLVMRFYQAVEQLLDRLGTQHTIAKVERGSVFASIKAFFKKPTTKKVIAEKLTVAVDALEQFGMAHVSMSMAQVDNLISQTLLNISQAAGDNDYAVCLHGVISYRITMPNGSKRQTSRRITPREAAILDRRPGLLDKPQGLLEVIGEIIDLEEGVGLPELTEGPGGQMGGSERG